MALIVHAEQHASGHVGVQGCGRAHISSMLPGCPVLRGFRREQGPGQRLSRSLLFVARRQLVRRSALPIAVSR